MRWIGLVAAGVLCAVVAGFSGWMLAGGEPMTNRLPDGFPLTGQPEARGSEHVHLELTSTPDGATAIVDGHARGQTPLSVFLTIGDHTLVLRHPDTVDEQRKISLKRDMNVRVNMWRRRPTAVQLRPAYPGASIVDVAFLADGRLALSMGLPAQAGSSVSGMLREPWLFDPSTGTLDPFVGEVASPRAAVLSISPDGHNAAYLESDQSGAPGGAAPRRLDAVWIAGQVTGGTPVRVFALAQANGAGTADPVSSEVEEVRDVTWTPDGRHLLPVVRLVSVSGGYPAAARTRLLSVDAKLHDGAAEPPVELVVLPAEVVPGSYSWAPDGQWVAFLSEATVGPGSAGFLALCAVDAYAGGAVSGFRYVADLGRQTDPARMIPVASVAWLPAPDVRLVYAADTPKVTISNPLGLPGTMGGEPRLVLGHAHRSGFDSRRGTTSRHGDSPDRAGLASEHRRNWPQSDSARAIGAREQLAGRSRR